MKRIKWFLVRLMMISLIVVLVGQGALTEERETVEIRVWTSGEMLDFVPKDVQDWVEREAMQRWRVATNSMALVTSLFMYKVNWNLQTRKPLSTPYISVIPMDIRPFANPEGIMRALTAGEAPAIYWNIGNFGDWAEKGLLADVTDLMEKWPKKNLAYPTLLKKVMYKGRYYAIPGRDVFHTGLASNSGAIRYKANVFQEAGIFDEEGNAAPPWNWTVKDFREIAIKLTNPKEKVWGFAFAAGARADAALLKFGQITGSIHNAGVVRPDPTGKNSWISAADTPEVIETLKLIQDMIWKDKSVLANTENQNPYSSADYSTRANMIFGDIGAVGGDMMESVGFIDRCVPVPLGDYGHRFQVVESGILCIDPTLTDKQKEAAFKWVDFFYCGEGSDIMGYIDTKAMRTFGPLWSGGGTWDIQYGDVLGIDPMEILEGVLPPSVIRDIPKYKEISVFPYNVEATLFNRAKMRSVLSGAVQAIVRDKNADPEIELKKAAGTINSAVLNYKNLAIDASYYRENYDAISQFYQEEMPDFYKNKWLKMMEEYYKVW